MNPLENTTPYVTLTFSLPEDFIPPSGGEGETYISVHTANSSTPIKVAQSREPVLRSGRWNFYFAHNYSDVSVKYLVTVSMTHNGVPLLIDLDYFVIVHRAPHRQTLHLSPIGRLYLQAQEPRAVQPEHAVTVVAHEHDDTAAQLTQIHISEKMAEAFYLEYDPDTVVPGKRYTLAATENEYHNSITVYPGSVVLKPFGRT
ncbi:MULTISPECIES: hypothetical protein [unclassified Pseudomonas]|jgi:hypothetical protein|uniref:hypothetical protein n=1 Tax=unclassified Pseudomonas TaxID=196821 RepID=UPI000C8779AA|nr:MULTISPECIES: hypothetical protein [unclassified Pseudomonas]PMU09218.1 hypothetical protein C1Y11_17840 [Pseudomonas sp. FW305-20]PMU17771.1 hypothetical protein C1Y10_14930 [Pseudomonas sp. FW305-122]PMU38703.1 hypothetical protein C1Y12_15650 [Pseudomonas sp. FW305-47B]PMX61612.1 hypothetical protein C1Y13_11340 [Pseudomonas sp. FW305-33]PMX70448.1 hypothetical protein C1X12_04400 [Pseudomonas sp. FW305-60]